MSAAIRIVRFFRRFNSPVLKTKEIVASFRNFALLLQLGFSGEQRAQRAHVHRNGRSSEEDSAAGDHRGHCICK